MPAEERAEAILDAARSVFLERGYAAARMEDVAARAGVAKGTVYLYFRGKETLFKALITSATSPPIQLLRTLLEDDRLSSAELLRRALGILGKEILTTDRRLVLRLVLTEGHNFPEIARFHHDEVIDKAMGLVRGIVERGVRRGEFTGTALARYPQLFAAPMLLAVIWEGLFGKIDPLDVDGLMQAHLEMLLHGLGAKS